MKGRWSNNLEEPLCYLSFFLPLFCPVLSFYLSVFLSNENHLCYLSFLLPLFFTVLSFFQTKSFTVKCLFFLLISLTLSSAPLSIFVFVYKTKWYCFSSSHHVKCFLPFLVSSPFFSFSRFSLFPFSFFSLLLLFPPVVICFVSDPGKARKARQMRPWMRLIHL